MAYILANGCNLERECVGEESSKLKAEEGEEMRRGTGDAY